MAGTRDHTSENNMSDQSEGCESSAMLSRRGFLKGIGALAVGAVAATIPISSALAAKIANDKAILEQAVAILSTSKLVRVVFKELAAKGFVFSLDQSIDSSSLNQHPDKAEVVGLALYPATSSRRANVSALVTTTIDLARNELFAIKYVIMHGKFDRIDVKSKTLFSDGRKNEKDRSIVPKPEEISRSGITPSASVHGTSVRGFAGTEFQQTSVNALCSNCGPWIIYGTCCATGYCEGANSCICWNAYKDCSTCSGSGSWREYTTFKGC